MGGIARGLGREFRVITPDLRNHGRSFHHPDMRYNTMAGDVAALMDSLGLVSAGIAGHSMGGKTAMRFALDFPDRVDRLVVVDIAPKPYEFQWKTLILAMMNLDLGTIRRRSDADRLLASALPDRIFRGFILQNLARNGRNGFYWRAGLGAILSAAADIGAGLTGPAFSKPALFIRGADSEYILDRDWPDILDLFPGAGLKTVMKAGHLVHFEKQDLMTELLTDFFRG